MSMSNAQKRRLESRLKTVPSADLKAGKKAAKQAKAIGITKTVTGTAMTLATPAVAGAAGLGTAAATGTATLAAAFPIGTLIVAIPAAIGLGLSTAKAVKKNRAKFLTQDQQKLVQLIKRYKKRSQPWRVKKTQKLLTAYDIHLAKGNKKTVAPFDGKKKRKHEFKWKAKKAKMEMQMTALYIAEYETMPPKKPTRTEKRKSQAIIQNIQTKQLQSIDPTVSALSFNQQGRLMLNKPLLVRQTARYLQRPDEMTRMMNQAPPAPPQPITRTLQQHPGAVPGIRAEEEETSTLGAVVAGLGVGTVVLIGSLL